MKLLSVVCPVYKEAEVIRDFYAALVAVLNNLRDYDYEVIFAADRSPDRTHEILDAIAATNAKVKVLHLSNRFGHQMSLLAGIDHSQGDAIVMMDSDLQHPPELIPALLEKHKEGFDLVLTLRQYSKDSGILRTWTSTLFYRVINVLSDIPIAPNAADYRLISKRVADVFRTQIRERNQFIRGLVGWVGFSSCYVPFEVQGRGGGKSKYSVGRLLHFAIDGVVSFSKKPLQMFLVLGLLIAGLALLHAGYTVMLYFFNATMPSGWATLSVIVSFLSGMNLAGIGVLGLYIGAIFDEVKGRPHYVIAGKTNF
jgi:polyisoprenyl-phosphate glycosyltransferase